MGRYKNPKYKKEYYQKNKDKIIKRNVEWTKTYLLSGVR